jgi:ribosome-associated protein
VERAAAITGGRIDLETRAIVDAVIAACEEKLALEPVALDVTTLLDSFDVMVVAAGRTDRQVKAICEEIERLVSERCHERPTSVEGLDVAQWVAFDYGSVVVHIFEVETRAYYDLEHLWNAALRLERAGGPADL